MNAKKRSCYYTNADSILNKRNELLFNISNSNPDIVCITEILPKNSLLPIHESDIQLEGYGCHSNINTESCHRGVLIYTKKNPTKPTLAISSRNPFR